MGPSAWGTWTRRRRSVVASDASADRAAPLLASIASVWQLMPHTVLLAGSAAVPQLPLAFPAWHPSTLSSPMPRQCAYAMDARGHVALAVQIFAEKSHCPRRAIL